MASFEPNPNTNSEIWIERPISKDLSFRIWHLIFFCFSGVVLLVILICCCIKVRVPRTKQEIEADYQRKKIAIKFRDKLKLIQNQEMDAMDLKRALEIIREDLSNETEVIEKKFFNQHTHAVRSMMAEPQQPQDCVSNRLAGIIKPNKFKQEV